MRAEVSATRVSATTRTGFHRSGLTVASVERRLIELPSRVRVARVLGILGLTAAVLYLITAPLIDSNPTDWLVRVGIVALIGLLLAVLPVQLALRAPEWASAALATGTHSTFVALTGEADSPYLPGFIAIAIVVGATSSLSTTLIVGVIGIAGLAGVAAADAQLDSIEVVSVISNGIVLLGSSLVVARLARFRRDELAGQARQIAALAELAEERRRASLADPLTGVGNRRAFEAQVDAANSAGHAHRHVLIADVDRLKRINDRLGHEAGDRVLVALASTLQRALRSDDQVYRIGGDEFAAFITGADPDDVVDRLGSKITTTVDGVGDVSMSIGTARSSAGLSGAALLERADRELYRAKRL